MTYEIVQCEVHWVASAAYSGNELPGLLEQIGSFPTEEEARAALVEKGFEFRTLWPGAVEGWRTQDGYGIGTISRVLKEIK
jgi:hypothetical protein